MKQFLLILTLICVSSLAFAQVSIYDIQYTTDPSGDSPYVGQVVTTGGVVTAVHYNGYVIYEGAAPWQAVFVYSYTETLAVGDLIELTGTVVEYNGMTEITPVTSYTIISHDNPVTPLVVASVDASQEAYESVLLTVENTTVSALLGYGEWTVDGTLVCNDINDYLYFPQLGDEIDSLTGNLFYSFGAFKLEPRFTADFAGDMIAHYALGGDVVTMNETRDVLPGHWVEVQGDLIVGIHASAPAGIPAIDTGGLIFPGLIDSHNHPQYNVLGPIPFTQLYEHRDEWRGDPLYDDFNAQLSAIKANPDSDLQTLNINKLAEVRAMCAGTTTIQGSNCYSSSYTPFAHQGIGINNAHHFPPRIYASTFPLSSSAATWQGRANENWRRFVVHIGEGTNQTALDEFAAWQALGMLDSRTTIIHGTALGATEWAAMAAEGAHLIWSPKSNVRLYGSTTDIPGALAAGVNMALAPDWTPSGCNDMLAEMKFAKEWSDDEWSGLLTPQMLAEMATCNSALALGMTDLRGSIATGLRADLMVIPGAAATPYDALLAADPENVMLTVISGRPGYGDPGLMNQFTYLEDVEDITLAGQPKRLALAITSHAITLSEQPFSEVIGTLETSYETALPVVCCFRGLEVGNCDLSDVPEFGPTMARLQVHPNPFNPRTSVMLTLQSEEDVTVEILGIDGRRLKVLVSGRFAAGEHVFPWSGSDAQGRAMPSGVYLVRMMAGTTELTEKISLVR
jgi:5-methylthioadenosine/S-adenosylhomocysteine deaminase